MLQFRLLALRYFFGAGKKEVAEMKFDNRLVAGIFIGLVLGLHYSASLVVYLPILTVVTLILMLRTLNR